MEMLARDLVYQVFEASEIFGIGERIVTSSSEIEITCQHGWPKSFVDEHASANLTRAQYALSHPQIRPRRTQTGCRCLGSGQSAHAVDPSSSEQRRWSRSGAAFTRTAWRSGRRRLDLVAFPFKAYQ